MVRAFSLIEVMVVVAILGIAAALAVPKMLPEIHKAQLDGDTEAAANFVARARSEAMFSKRCVRVHIGNTANGNIAAAATPSTRLTAERLNSFDCDNANESTAPTIDGSATRWIQIDTLDTSTPKVVFSFQQVPASLAGTSNEIRFRPNGRVWTNEPLTAALSLPGNLQNDDAVLVVTHSSIVGQNEIGNAAVSGTRRVLVQGNGLLCALDRGVVPSGTPMLCP